MHPILFYVWGNFYIGTYGVMVATGALCAVALAVFRARRAKLDPAFLVDMLFYSTIAGFIGARVTFILVSLDDFVLHPMDYILSREGFVFLGGVVTGGAVAAWYIKKKDQSIGLVADVAAPCLPLAHFFGRLGCFFAGCCWGRVATGFWSSIGMTFPAAVNKKGELVGSFVYIDHLRRGLIPPDALRSLPVIPTQLIEAGANLVICILILLLGRKSHPRGWLLVLYILMYSVARFLIEFLRGDTERGVWFGLISTSQAISLLLIAGTIAFLIHQSRRSVHTS